MDSLSCHSSTDCLHSSIHISIASVLQISKIPRFRGPTQPRKRSHRYKMACMQSAERMQSADRTVIPTFLYSSTLCHEHLPHLPSLQERNIHMAQCEKLLIRYLPNQSTQQRHKSHTHFHVCQASTHLHSVPCPESVEVATDASGCLLLRPFSQQLLQGSQGRCCCDEC